MCKHDPLYRQDNEANGGAGCPLCAAQVVTPVCNDLQTGCLTCVLVEDCEAHSFLECAFVSAPPPMLTAGNLEMAGTYSPRE